MKNKNIYQALVVVVACCFPVIAAVILLGLRYLKRRAELNVALGV
jgi:hypothetical protein